MSIQVNTGIPSVNWDSLLRQVNDLAKVSETGDKPALTFSATEADGMTVEIKTGQPEE